MNDVKGVVRLGAFDSLTHVADKIKKIREDWQWVAAGSRKIKADVFTSADRQEEQRRFETMRSEHRREQAVRESQQAPPADRAIFPTSSE